MSIFKTPKSPYWQLDIGTPGGTRVRRSTGTADKRKAQEYHDRLKAQLWEQERLGVEPDHCFEEAAVKMLKLSIGQSSYRDKLRHVEYWNSIFGGRTLRSLTSAEILNNLPTHQQKGKKWVDLESSTKNRYISTIKRIMSIAYDAGWIPKRLKIPTFKEAKVNVRWITRREAKRLISNINLIWLRDMSIFALATGCRMSEITALTWKDVDLDRSTAWIGQGDTKSERSRSIPLNQDAIDVLTARRFLRQEYCFTRDEGNGIRIGEIDRRAFNRALSLSNIENFTFHDLRHTWASWHVQKGTPLLALKELGGWEKIEMVQKYAHLATNHLAYFADNSKISKSELTTNFVQTKLIDKEKAA